MWPAPEPGDIVWCRFPERPRDRPGPKPRPALVLVVTEHEDGTAVTVAYGTSQKLDRLMAGEFVIRKADNAAAYLLAGLSFDTKFDLGKTVAVTWNDTFFAVAPEAKYGQTPKLGSLHAGMMKTATSAARAVRRSG
jgi:PemK-like, MazF-like toxin of type II toxin-antitoxin system